MDEHCMKSRAHRILAAFQVVKLSQSLLGCCEANGMTVLRS